MRTHPPRRTRGRGWRTLLARRELPARHQPPRGRAPKVVARALEPDEEDEAALRSGLGWLSARRFAIARRRCGAGSGLSAFRAIAEAPRERRSQLASFEEEPRCVKSSSCPTCASCDASTKMRCGRMRHSSVFAPRTRQLGATAARIAEPRTRAPPPAVAGGDEEAGTRRRVAPSSRARSLLERGADERRARRQRLEDSQAQACVRSGAFSAELAVARRPRRVGVTRATRCSRRRPPGDGDPGRVLASSSLGEARRAAPLGVRATIETTALTRRSRRCSSLLVDGPKLLIHTSTPARCRSAELRPVAARARRTRAARSGVNGLPTAAASSASRRGSRGSEPEPVAMLQGTNGARSRPVSFGDQRVADCRR